MGRWAVRRSGLVRLALLALIWGSSFVWIKIGLRGFGLRGFGLRGFGLRGFTPMQVAFLRVLLAAGVLL